MQISKHPTLLFSIHSKMLYEFYYFIDKISLGMTYDIFRFYFIKQATIFEIPGFMKVYLVLLNILCRA